MTGKNKNSLHGIIIKKSATAASDGGLFALYRKGYFMKFTATFCTFQGVPCYIFKQWRDDVCICSQFIPKRNFAEFCTAAGIDKSKIEFEK